MKFFNSVTGKVEDDGKDLPEMDMINIPAGRMASPDGSQDVNFPVYADLLKRERQNSNQIELGMLQNPESNEFVNSLFTQGSNTIRPADASQKQEMNPLVKAELMKKYNIQDKSQGSERMPTASITPKDDSVAPVLAAQKAPSVLDQFSPEKYQEALQQMKERQSGTALAQFASGVGDALARRDSSGTDRYFQDLRNNIQDQTTGEFGRQKATAINDIKTKKELDKNDPNSQESQNFRKLVQSTMPNIAKTYGENFNLVTAADKESILDFGKMREMIDARKQTAQLSYDLKRSEAAKKNSPDGRLKSLSGTDKARYDNALMTLKALDEMGTALDNGQNTFSLIGDNDYTSASRRATEAYGRMQSGGAINKDEEARFEKTLPGKTDTKEIQRKKILSQRNEMISRLRTLGFTPEDSGYEPKDFNYGSNKKDKPKQITQNGHVYNLNENTGEYE